MSRGIKLPREVALPAEMVLWAGGSQLLAKLLHRRGIRSREEIEQLLNPLQQPEPDFSDYPPLMAALDRINSALAEGEKIAIYGDYDVDGITATTVLVTALKLLGGDVIWHIPNRFSEGYGMHWDRVEKLAQAGANLIITCDCGISNHEEIAWAQELGMDVIITDHHTPPEELPQAQAIVNFKLLPPGHPSRDLPGVGTAYILMRELLRRHDKKGEDLLDLVALGIIADVVPLKGHNRRLYLQGLTLLNQAARPGLEALLAVSNVQPGLVDEEKLGFQIAPRINAAGRLEDGSIAVNLLLAPDKERATPLARQLDQLNNLRKEISRSIMEKVSPEQGKPLVAYSDQWHQGVLGIAAGQYTSAQQAPAILMTDSQQGQGIVGSARSVEGINIYSVLQRCQDYLDKFGGHPAAAGFSLARENLPRFTQAVQGILDAEMENWTPPPLSVDLVVEPRDVNLDLVEELSRLAPCGEENPRPLLYCSGLALKSVRSVGSGHILTLGDRWRSFSAGLWNRPAPEPGGSIGAVFTVSQDVYRGERSVWATLEAWWPGKDRPVVRDEYKISDRRGKSWRQLLRQFPKAAIYREGVQWQDHPGSTRNNLPGSATLLLLTPPPAAGVLRQILAMVEPELVVLGYSPVRDSFLAEFLGALKYSFQAGGIVSLSALAAGLAHTEETILAALKLLAVSGIIQYQVEQGKIVLQKLEGTKIKSGSAQEKLRGYLGETSAFRAWLLEASSAEIMKIRP